MPQEGEDEWEDEADPEDNEEGSEDGRMEEKEERPPETTISHPTMDIATRWEEVDEDRRRWLEKMKKEKGRLEAAIRAVTAAQRSSHRSTLITAADSGCLLQRWRKHQTQQ